MVDRGKRSEPEITGPTIAQYRASLTLSLLNERVKPHVCYKAKVCAERKSGAGFKALVQITLKD